MSAVSKSKEVLEFKKGVFGDSYDGCKEDKTPYLDLAAVAPSPSRDYYRIYVTKSEVALTQWRISHGPKSVPVELKIPLDGFAKDIRIPSEVNRIFGKECVEYIMGLSRGHVDKIMHVPIPILARIFQLVGIKNLKNVAPVCSKFSEVCRSDDLWKRYYFQYGGFDAAAVETKHQADYLSWKSLFFINRLHYKIGNAEKFPGLFAEHNLNIPNNRRLDLRSSSPSSAASVGSQQQMSRRNVTRDLSSAFIRGRTARIVDGNLVPRASATKVNESTGKKNQDGSSPRQKATRHTLVSHSKNESRKLPPRNKH